jgi:uncharacterized protein
VGRQVGRVNGETQSGAAMSKAYEQLQAYISGLEIIDTHEHLPAREEWRDQKCDVLGEYLFHYMSSDLVSAGLCPGQLKEATDPSRPLMQRWRMIEPFWEAARNTGYARSLNFAARDLYGISRIDGSTIEALNEAFCATRRAGGTYDNVLKRKCKIRLSILDAILGKGLECDRRYFAPAIRLDEFVLLQDAARLPALARWAKMDAIGSLADLEEACRRVLDDSIQQGMLCLKTGAAYGRSLRFEKVRREDAQKDFDALLARTSAACQERTARPIPGRLQDYMMHHVLRLADQRGLLIQVHTGLQEGNGNDVSHSDPSLLSNLFLEYPNVRFDCFHIGYPYQQVLAALAKNFRNVFIDFAWVHIISPAAAVRALVEYLDSVPANKISGFGGDYVLLDGVYGHQYMARQNIARALAIKVEQEAFDLDYAMQAAKMILHDNPVAIFRLQPVLAGTHDMEGR